MRGRHEENMFDTRQLLDFIDVGAHDSFRRTPGTSVDRMQHSGRIHIHAERGLPGNDGQVVDTRQWLSDDLEILGILQRNGSRVTGIVAAFAASDPYVAVRFEPACEPRRMPWSIRFPARSSFPRRLPSSCARPAAPIWRIGV